MMKSFILIAVLAALTIRNDAASVPNEVAPFIEEVMEFQESVEEYIKDYNPDGSTGRQLSRDDDEFILFHDESFVLEPIPYTVQHRDIFWRGNSTTFINRVSYTTPPAVPGHIFIGMYRTHAHVRFTSAPGVGLQSRVRFYGHYTDWV